MSMARRRLAPHLLLRTRGPGMWDFIPESLRQAIRRRSNQIRGAALLSVALFALASLVTWTATDPSLSNASSGVIANALGRPGAIVSDLLTQFLGLASLALLLPLAFWGWRLVTFRPVPGEKLRAGALVLGVLGACAVLGTLPRLPSWPILSGMGGAVGDLFPRLLGVARGGMLGLFDLLAIGGVGAGVMVLGLYLACARLNVEADDLDAPEPDQDLAPADRRAISLGALTHAILSTKARLFAWRAAPNSAGPPLASRDGIVMGERGRDETGRVEPRLSSAPASDTPSLGGQRRAGAEAGEAPRASAPSAPRGGRERREGAPRRAGAYRSPDLNLLTPAPPAKGPVLTAEALKETANLLEGTLGDFGVRGEIVQVRPGPVVTLYELEPAPGIKSSRVIGLADDIARSMSAISARVAVVPGRNAIGIELPNPRRDKVLLRELLATRDFSESGHKLAIALGKTIGGEPVIVDLARMPHLLVAGTTGSGKSVAINTMILSLLYRMKPEQCRFIMVDPKMLELSVYDGIPHLLAPVVTDPKKAVVALRWAVREMEDRYKKMSKLGVRNIDGFNARVVEAEKRGESIARTVQTGFDHDTGEAIYEREEMELGPLPYIVVIVDEMADLMLVAGKEIEGAIQRLAQMARAAGIHLIMATQRPSVDVITGTIKANFPTRISFQVTSKIDSRTILGEMGAEQLLGQGDMLYMAGGGRINRVHGPFVSDEEVEHVVRHLKAQGTPTYVDAVTADLDEDDEAGGAVFDRGAFGEEGQDLYSQAVAVVLRDKKCSTSYIQRRLQIGYNRAASLVERMEREGVVSAPNHAGKREVLLSDEAAQ